MLDIPTVPAAIITLLGLFAPYAVAVVTRPEWSPLWKKLISIVVALALAAIALVIYFAATGTAIPEWWNLLLLSVVVTQASYALVTKPSATRLEYATSPDGTPRTTSL